MSGGLKKLLVSWEWLSKLLKSTAIDSKVGILQLIMNWSGFTILREAVQNQYIGKWLLRHSTELQFNVVSEY